MLLTLLDVKVFEMIRFQCHCKEGALPDEAISQSIFAIILLETGRFATNTRNDMYVAEIIISYQ
jgi:hypothetical protein